MKIKLKLWEAKMSIWRITGYMVAVFFMLASGIISNDKQDLYYAIEQDGVICGYAHVII